MTRRKRAYWRSIVVLLFVLMVAGLFFVRLISVQLVQASALDRESQNRRSIVTAVPGERGSITDASGVVLAESVPRYTITASPRLAASEGHVQSDADRIAAAAGLSPSAVRSALTGDPSSQYAMITKTASLDSLRKVKALGIDWLDYSQVDQRTYPNGAVAGNLVGFVGADGTPQAGIEYAQQRCLAGADGSVTTESALDGTPIPGTAVQTTAAKQGGTVKLTIDRDLQWFAQQTLAARAQQVGAKWGSVVVEDVKTGKLLAVADWPTVDPGNVAATANTDVSALGSRAFTAPFEPGSTMKTVTAAALIDAGKATPDSHVIAPYRFTTPQGADVNDDELHGDERLTLTGVLVQSSNTGMSQLGMRMSDRARYDVLKRFGFGSATEVGFGAEASGTLGADAPNWDPQSRLATMFGQGLTTTSVQVASAYATIANGGVREPVSLVESCTDADGTVHANAAGTARRVVSAKTAKETVSMLENVATKGWLAADVKIPGYRVGIKTGTAQESDGHGGYAKGFLVSMAGVAPADDPRYVVYVDLDDAVKMNTSQATAPIFRQVMARVLQENGVVPSGTSSPNLPTSY